MDQVTKTIEEIQLVMLNAVEKIYETTEFVKKNGDKKFLNEATALYNAGYRKQVEAEWKFGEKNGRRGWYCTNCFAGFTGENAEWIAYEHKYCPKCGAKMKGAE